MSIDKISCSKDEFITILDSVCSELHIEITVQHDREKEVQFDINRESKKSKLRVYVKNDGLKLDTTIGKDKELNLEIEEKIKLNLNKTKHAMFKYENISEEKFNNIYRLLNEFSVGAIELKARENRDPNKSNFFEIKNVMTNECIRISRFKNGTVTVEGIVWILWEDICQIIEINDDNISVNDIINRILVEDEKNNVDNSDFSPEEEIIKELISPEVYNFLDEHYKDYLISAQCILSNNVKMKEYSTVLCPVAKVLEGYLKSLLIELKLERKLAIKGNWTFGKIFTEDGIKSFNGGDTTEAQAKELKEVYSLVKEFRHDVNHGGPKPKLVIRDRNICLLKHKEILTKIKVSYFNIFE
ncbi:MAG: hypothetical protein ACRC6T_05320 [Sarcina sp.]